MMNLATKLKLCVQQWIYEDPEDLGGCKNSKIVWKIIMFQDFAESAWKHTKDHEDQCQIDNILFIYCVGTSVFINQAML